MPDFSNHFVHINHTSFLQLTASSHSNQQPMERTKFSPYTFSFSIICFTQMYITICKKSSLTTCYIIQCSFVYKAGYQYKFVDLICLIWFQFQYNLQPSKLVHYKNINLKIWQQGSNHTDEQVISAELRKSALFAYIHLSAEGRQRKKSE